VERIIILVPKRRVVTTMVGTIDISFYESSCTSIVTFYGRVFGTRTIVVPRSRDSKPSC